MISDRTPSISGLIPTVPHVNSVLIEPFSCLIPPLPLLPSSALIMALKLAEMAGSPDAGAFSRGGWPVVNAQ